MYIPKQFEITNRDEIFSFIDANAFGQLISNIDGKLSSTHMPFLLSEDKRKIFAHIAKKNPQHLELDGEDVLITLEGAHDYISPSWYSSSDVPTWNYQAVHINGCASVFKDNDKLKLIVDALTDKYESTFDKPWVAEYKAEMLNGIIGIEVSINEIQCKYKLSQNRSSQDQSQVIKKLKSSGSYKLAEAMERNELLTK